MDEGGGLGEDLVKQAGEAMHKAAHAAKIATQARVPATGNPRRC